MGLDSVQLLVDIENHFGIQIPDSDAEKINTVQAMVNVVAKYLNIEVNDMYLKKETLRIINNALNSEDLINREISYSDFIFKTLDPFNDKVWDTLSQMTGLVLPKPFIAGIGHNKVFSFLAWNPKYEWEKVTAGHFIDAVCARNHEKLIDRKNISDIYEILVSIIAITVESIGVDYYEVEPEKSFTNDLGID